MCRRFSIRRTRLSRQRINCASSTPSANQRPLRLESQAVLGHRTLTCMRSHLGLGAQSWRSSTLKCWVTPDFDDGKHRQQFLNTMSEVPPPAPAPPAAVSALALIPPPTPPPGPLTYRERLAQFRILEEKRIELIEVLEVQSSKPYQN
jgi:hypothetical protein